MRILVAGVMLAILIMPVFASPAKACSCAGASDIPAWVDESQAAFVGTLIEKRGHDLEGEAVYVFQVEAWVKGDLGDVIEVNSAADGAACGFEFWDPDERIGAIIHEENGQLHGGLCSQIDPDVLLTVMNGPTPSSTGIGHLLVGNGWSSARLTLLDEAGGHVADLSPPLEAVDWDSTLGLETCPGGEHVIQWTQTRVVVWNVSTLEPISSHEVTGKDGYPVLRDASCRSRDASSIWVVAAHEFEAELFDLVDGDLPTMSLEGDQFSIGSDFVISQPDHEGDATWVDIPSGDRTVLTETPPDDLRSISVATHPTERLIALVETDFNEDEATTATLSIVDGTGARLQVFDIPWETYSPTWLDESRVAVKAYDFDNWEQSFGFIFNLDTGASVEIEGWDVDYTVAEGDRLYGVRGSDVLTTDLSAGDVEAIATLPSESAGPLIVLDESRPIAPSTTVTVAPEPTAATTPPLVAPENGSDTLDIGSTTRWIAGGAIVGFLVLLVWLARRPSDERH